MASSGRPSAARASALLAMSWVVLAALLLQPAYAQLRVKATGASRAAVRAGARRKDFYRHDFYHVPQSENKQEQEDLLPFPSVEMLVGEVLIYPSEASESTPADNATSGLGTAFSPQLDYVLKVRTAVGIAVTDQTLWYLAWPGLVNADQVLQTGQTVSVAGILVGTSLYVSEIKIVTAAPPQDFFYGATSVTLSSITFLVSLCGQASVSNVTAFKGLWTQAGATAAKTDVTNTLESIYRDCSWGKVQFPDASNVVVDLRSQTPPTSIRDAIPCSGSSMTCSGVVTTLDGGQCASLRNTWMQWAINTSLSVYGIDASKYSRRVMIIPPLSVFMVSGLAMIGIGADGSTNAFIQGPYAMASPRSAFHELGHNYGLRHSWSIRSGVLRDYDDLSCGMGSVAINGTKTRCLNAPQAWYAGWAEPVDMLNSTNLSVGQWITRTLPIYMSTKTNFIRVTPTWQSVVGPSYFFSWRQSVGRDTVLEPWYYSGISVHEYNGTRAAQSSAYPVLQASFITLGATLKFPLADLAAKFTVNGTTSATIRFCRFTQTTETSCTDGLDNDCNGLADASDPACKAVAG